MMSQAQQALAMDDQEWQSWPSNKDGIVWRICLLDPTSADPCPIGLLQCELGEVELERDQQAIQQARHYNQKVVGIIRPSKTRVRTSRGL